MVVLKFGQKDVAVFNEEQRFWDKGQRNKRKKGWESACDNKRL